MGKIIEVTKDTTRNQLDEELTNRTKNKGKIDLDKYVGKVKFGVDGLTYQLKVRDEWR